MADKFRALFKEMVDWIDQETYTSRGEDPLVTRARALLAEADGPAVPDGREPASVALQPSDAALADFTAWFCRNYPGPDTLIHRPEWHAPKVFRAAADAIARWGRPAAAPVPGASNTYFEFVVLDGYDCTQAGGIAPTYAQALSEGQHYLAQYQQDGPHELELRRVEVLNPDALPLPPYEGGEVS